MKKLLFIPLLLALCLLMNSCFLFLAVPKEPIPDPITLDEIGTPKTFEKAGITLLLTDKFKEEQSEMGFDAYYTSEFCGVVVMKESFMLAEGLAERSLEQYIKNVIKNNGHEGIEPQERDGLWYYVNDNSNNVRRVYSYVYKGTDAFYIVQYIVNSVDEDTLKETIHDWAKATQVS